MLLRISRSKSLSRTSKLVLTIALSIGLAAANSGVKIDMVQPNQCLPTCHSSGIPTHPLDLSTAGPFTVRPSHATENVPETHLLLV